MDALRHFPTHADNIQTAQGKANLIKKDIFRNLMWYAFPSSSKHYPLTIERVKEILELNKQGVFPEELQAVELEATAKEKLKIDVGFVNDVGQITLKNLEKKKSKNKNKKTNKPQSAGTGNRPDALKANIKPAKDTPVNNNPNPKPQKNRPNPNNTAAPKEGGDVSVRDSVNKNNPPKPNINAAPRPNKNRNNNNRKPRPEANSNTNTDNTPV
jgi:hypothetical protein